MLNRLIPPFLVALSTQSALAISDEANPWLAIDMATCIAHRGADYETDIGAPIDIQFSEMQGGTDDLPSYCRVAGRIDVNIGFEIRLPLTWNGRLLTAGCGLLCGQVQMHRTDDALIRGYAVAHTDMGHQSESVGDATWAYNNREAEIDFNHRATHLTTLLLKSVAKRHYERDEAVSYFRGCSTGGRQGLEAAMRYPDDYDGIIAGAPASDASFPNILWALERASRDDGSSILTDIALSILQGATLANCDDGDGLSDGIIADPERCTFDPGEMQCRGGQTRNCLNFDQVEAVRALYQGPRTSGGRPVTSMGYSVGDEPGWALNFISIEGNPPGAYFTKVNFFRYWAYDPDPDLAIPMSDFSYDFDTDPWRIGMNTQMPAPDGGYSLARFKDQGGKLILYHGWNDEILTPASSLDYYAEQSALLGGKDALDPFFRLFMIPGMRHCGSGPGADAVDFLSAIESWTEGDAAPYRITAYKLGQNVPNFIRRPRFPEDLSTVMFSRPVFPYPDVAHYDGSDPPDHAASFIRVTRP